MVLTDLFPTVIYDKADIDQQRYKVRFAIVLESIWLRPAEDFRGVHLLDVKLQGQYAILKVKGLGFYDPACFF